MEWKPINEEELIYFLVKKMKFKKDRIEKGI